MSLVTGRLVADELLDVGLYESDFGERCRADVPVLGVVADVSGEDFDRSRPEGRVHFARSHTVRRRRNLAEGAAGSGNSSAIEIIDAERTSA